MKSVLDIVTLEAMASIGSEIMAFAMCGFSNYENEESKDRLVRAMARSWLNNVTVQAALGYDKEAMNRIIKEEMDKMKAAMGDANEEQGEVRTGSEAGAE